MLSGDDCRVSSRSWGRRRGCSVGTRPATVVGIGIEVDLAARAADVTRVAAAFEASERLLAHLGGGAPRALRATEDLLTPRGIELEVTPKSAQGRAVHVIHTVAAEAALWGVDETSSVGPHAAFCSAEGKERHQRCREPSTARPRGDVLTEATHDRMMGRRGEKVNAVHHPRRLVASGIDATPLVAPRPPPA